MDVAQSQTHEDEKCMVIAEEDKFTARKGGSYWTEEDLCPSITDLVQLGQVVGRGNEEEQGGT